MAGPGTAAATIDQTKLDRLTAIAKGGKEGLAQYDAAQASLAQERATMAKGLTAEAQSAGFHGPTVAGAPIALAGQVNAGLSPFDAALAADKASFGRNIAQGGIANLRYLDMAKAAIAPALAAKAAGGGGGGRGGSGGTGNLGNLTDTQLRQALISAAASARSQQIAAIHEAETRAARGADQSGYINLSGPQFANEVNQIQWSRNSSAPPAPPPSPRVRSGLANLGAAQPPAQLPLVTATANAAQAKVDQYQKLLAQRVAQQQSTERAPIIPLATQIGQQAGVDPLLLSSLLGPSQEAAYQRAIAATLPKTAKTAAAKPGPVPYEQAAQLAGLRAADIPKILGLNYDTGRVDSKGNRVKGNLVTDVVDTARDMANRGFDLTSYTQYLESHLATDVVKKYRDVIDFGIAVGSGFFPQTTAPAAPVNPYQAYYEQRYPLVSSGQ